MRDCNHVDSVHGVEDEHLVHAKALNSLERIEDEVSRPVPHSVHGTASSLLVVNCVGTRTPGE